LAVAAPVAGDEVQMVNLAWGFSREGLRRALGLDGLEVMNDFTAIAWSLPQLDPGNRCPIGLPAAGPRATLGVLGPGTGLGVSAVVPCGDGWMALATEGGHVTLPAMDDEEAAVVGDLRSRFGHCSAERVLSGPGLVAVYECLRGLAGHEPTRDSSVSTPAAVTARALSGEDAYAVQALDLFFRFLGTVASNLALSVGARGGIYLAGGILPRIAGALTASDFRTRFTDKGRYRAYLEAIPTFLITHPHPALLGLRDAILKHRPNINPA
jgi:glucokinase